MNAADRADHVLDAIDGALYDFELSADAMRWTPPEDRRPPAAPSANSPLVVYDETHTWRLDPDADVVVSIHTGELAADIAQGQRRPVPTRLHHTHVHLRHQAADSRFPAVEWEPFRSHVLTTQQSIEAATPSVQPPTDPRTRALWLRQRRNTGPTRPTATRARRPREHT